MGPIFTWVIAETVTRKMVKMLTRQCPKCNRRQVVAKEKRMSNVACERCGAPVPPKPESKRRRS